MGKKIDLSGKKFNKLLVIREDGRNKFSHRMWLCQCDCGKTNRVSTAFLLNGMTKSCGCLKGEKIRERCVTHGQSNRGKVTAEYNIWGRMIQRCTNEKVERYPNYGGRGIKVCDRWMESFENFFEDMGLRPSKDHSLDRFPNLDGDYEPSNCRWGTGEQQHRGKTNNRWLEHNGEKMILADWATRWGVRSSAILGHFYRGKTFESIFNYFENRLKNASSTG